MEYKESEARFTKQEAKEYLGCELCNAFNRLLLNNDSYPIELLRIIKKELES